MPIIFVVDFFQIRSIRVTPHEQTKSKFFHLFCNGLNYHDKMLYDSSIHRTYF